MPCESTVRGERNKALVVNSSSTNLGVVISESTAEQKATEFTET
jgi:hypothetical protein